MENLINNLNQSEKTIAFLKEQLTILTALSAHKQEESEQAEIKKLSAENERLRNDLLCLKEDLRYHEVQNGVQQFSLPQTQSQTQSLPAASTDVVTSADTKKEVVETPAIQNEGKQPKKKKNEGKGKQTNSAQQQQKGDESTPIDASRLNMKIGRIVNVKKHEDADGLYVEEVDVGEEKNRTVVSGLVKHYTLEQMENRMGIFLCNLKPAKMRGVLSEGMIMCASSPEKVEILQIPVGAAIGERVICEGFPGEPDAQLNPKKKIWEQIQPDLNVGSNGVPAYKGGAFTVVGKGFCTAPSMRNCMVK